MPIPSWGLVTVKVRERHVWLRTFLRDAERGTLNCPMGQVSTHKTAFILLSRGQALSCRKPAFLFTNL